MGGKDIWLYQKRNVLIVKKKGGLLFGIILKDLKKEINMWIDVYINGTRVRLQEDDEVMIDERGYIWVNGEEITNY